MKQPTKEQLADPKWWDENAPEGCELVGVAYIGGEAWSHEFMTSGITAMSAPCNAHCRFFERPEAKPVKPDWDDGELPPIRTECEATWLELPDGGGRDFERVLIKGYYDHVDALPQVWLTTWGGDELVLRLEDCVFRPLRTQEQIDRDDLTETITRAVRVHLNEQGISNALWAAGWRKEASHDQR